MPGQSTLCRAAGLVILALAPIAIHVALVTGKWPVLVFVIPALQLLGMGAALLVRRGSRQHWVTASAAALLVSLAFVGIAQLDLASLPGLPHALAYSSLLVVFGFSLLPGREPVLTRLVLKIRGPLPPELLAYTRHVTAAWCCFFAAQLALSLTLFLFAPLAVWSLFINVLNLPLVVVMFAIEYAYRVARFPNFRHDRLSDFSKFAAEFSKRTPRQADSA
jgi:uncharacterized membrane protein